MTAGTAVFQLFLDRVELGRVLLRVNHHAFKGVDRPEHLRIFCLDDVFFLVRLYVFSAAQREERPFLFCAHGHPNVRRHAIPLNHLLARRVVFRCGEAQS